MLRLIAAKDALVKALGEPVRWGAPDAHSGHVILTTRQVERLIQLLGDHRG